MTRDDIIRMAADAGMTGLKEGGVLENFERFVALVAAAEREAILKLGDSLGYVDVDAIRARGET